MNRKRLSRRAGYARLSAGKTKHGQGLSAGAGIRASSKGKRKRWDEILKRLQAGPVRMAEVGVWMGKNAFALLSKRSDLIMWLIDRWMRPDADDSYATSGAEMAVKPQSRFDEAYHATVQVAQRFPDRTHIVKDTTIHAATQFEDGFFDCVFVDADHSYEGCRADILAWRSKVRPGGLLCGHDYANKAGDVKRAVDEIFPSGVSVGDDHTWFVRL